MKKFPEKGERRNTRPKKKLPYVMSKEQLVKVLGSVDDIKLAMVLFIGVFQGLRIGEILRLKWCDVDLNHGELRVLDGKNTKRYKSGYGKDRIVPINDMFIPVLKKWKCMNQEQDYVIPSNAKHDEDGIKNLRRVYQKLFHTNLARVGLQEVDYYQADGKPRYKFHVHTLRHVCGTNLYRAGMDIYQIKEYLGHEDIETTQVYCELGRDDLKVASHKAFAYPKSQLPIPDRPEIELKLDKEMLFLQKDIMEKKLELARIHQQIVVTQEVR